MRNSIALSSLVLLCASFGAALGGGLFEHFVLVPLWSKTPPASFEIIQPGTGVPLQRFWIPVHSAITLFLIAALVLAWRDRRVRRLLLIGAASYVVMRTWSALFFIPEMLAFQRVPPESAPTQALTARVASWTYWSWFREPLDVISLLCSFLALHAFRKNEEGPATPLAAASAVPLWRVIVYWVLSAPILVETIVGAWWDLSQTRYVRDAMVHLGYPFYLLTIMGVAKVLAVAALITPGWPRLKEWAYAGLFFVYAGAAWSHAAVDDPTSNVVVPALFAAATLVSWATRPPDRRDPMPLSNAWIRGEEWAR